MTDSTEDKQSNNNFFGSLREKFMSSKKDTNHEISPKRHQQSLNDAIKKNDLEECATIIKKNEAKYKGMRRDEILSIFDDDIESLDVAGKARLIKFMHDIGRQDFNDPKDKYDTEYNQYFMDKLVTEVFLIKTDDQEETDLQKEDEEKTLTFEQKKQQQCDKFLKEVNAEIYSSDDIEYQVQSKSRTLVEYAVLDLKKRGFKSDDITQTGPEYNPGFYYCDIILI